MADLQGSKFVVRATIEIKRAATGEVETYELAGAATPEEAAEMLAHLRGTKHHGSTGAMVGEGAGLSNATGDKT